MWLYVLTICAMKYELLGKLSLKCVLVGDTECGKTALAAKITNKEFKREYIPTTFDNYAGRVFNILRLSFNNSMHKMFFCVCVSVFVLVVNSN